MRLITHEYGISVLFLGSTSDDPLPEPEPELERISTGGHVMVGIPPPPLPDPLPDPLPVPTKQLTQSHNIITQWFICTFIGVGTRGHLGY